MISLNKTFTTNKQHILEEYLYDTLRRDLLRRDTREGLELQLLKKQQLGCLSFVGRFMQGQIWRRCDGLFGFCMCSCMVKGALPIQLHMKSPTSPSHRSQIRPYLNLPTYEKTYQLLFLKQVLLILKLFLRKGKTFIVPPSASFSCLSKNFF